MMNHSFVGAIPRIKKRARVRATTQVVVPPKTVDIPPRRAILTEAVLTLRRGKGMVV
jgi:hypothetical protein